MLRNKKKIIVVVSAVIFLTAVLCGCGAGSEDEDVEAEHTAAALEETADAEQTETQIIAGSTGEMIGPGADEELSPSPDPEKNQHIYGEYKIRCSFPYLLDFGFSNGYAWTEYGDDDREQCICMIDENGELVFTARLDDLRDFMGKGDFRNIVCQDGVSCLYTNGSYMIFDTNGNILDFKTGTNYVSYHMLGYGYDEFLIWKEVKDITGKSSDYIYTVDMHGSVLREPYPVDGGSTSNQRFTCLGKGIFTDGLYFCDLSQNIWKHLNARLGSKLTHWIGRESCGCNHCWIFDNYPVARVFAYYGDDRGYILRDQVYGVLGMDSEHKRHCVIYDINENVIADIDDEFSDMKIERFGLYSGGYIPVMLKDGNNDSLVTVLDSNGEALFSPISPDLLHLCVQSCYDGFFAVKGNRANDDVKIITPAGEVRYICDDVSELGNDAYMYADDGSFLSGGYLFEMNSLLGRDHLYSAAGEIMKNMYVSLDGTRIIDTVLFTDRTQTLGRLDGKLSAANASMTDELSDIFGRSSNDFDRDLPKIAAIMSEKSENNSSGAITSLYKSYGIKNIETYHYGEGMLGGGASAFGTMKLDINGTETDILVITCRGSQSAGEFIGDLFKGWIGDKTDPFLGQNVWHNNYEFKEKVWSGLNDCLDKYPDIKTSGNLKILVTGHSLGGAAAGMVGTKIDSEIASNTFFNPVVSKEDVYVYTFGAIKVVDSDTNVSSGYENIHNIYNYYDAFGYRGNYSMTNASSANAKFGHTELFELGLV